MTQRELFNLCVNFDPSPVKERHIILMPCGCCVHAILALGDAGARIQMRNTNSREEVLAGLKAGLDALMSHLLGECSAALHDASEEFERGIEAISQSLTPKRSPVHAR